MWKSVRTTAERFIIIAPLILGMLLLISLLRNLLSGQLTIGLFGYHPLSDTLLGAAIGSVAVGHPLISYVLGGELLRGGVDLAAVTALIVTWVTVGLVHLPLEIITLGRRFGIYRNLLAFLGAILIAFSTVATLRLLAVTIQVD